jgi:MFS family permease
MSNQRSFATHPAGRSDPDGHPAWPTILLVLVIVEITSAFETGMVFGALATVMREFRDPVGTGWLITGALLVGAASAAVCARLGDLYGRKRVALVLLLLTVAGSMVSALSPHLGGVIAGRAVQGVATVLLPLCVGMVRELLPTRRVGIAIGWLAAMATSSAGLGIVLGGWVVDHLGWRSAFWFSAGHAGLAALLLAVFVPKTPGQGFKGRLDLLGGILFAPSVAALLLAVTRLRGQWDDPLTLSLAVGGLLGLLWWIWHELHHPDPMLDVRVFTRRQTGLTMLLTVCYGLGTSQQMLLVLQIAQQPDWTGIGLGLSATAAGMIKLPSILAGLTGAPWSGAVAGRRSGKVAAVRAALVICAGWTGLLLWHDSLAALVTTAFVIAFGNAALYAAAVVLVTEDASAERTSEVNGQLAVMRALSFAAGTVLTTLMLASDMVSDASRGEGSFSSPDAYQQGLLYVIGCSVGCLLVALMLPRRQPRAVAAKSVAPSSSLMKKA